MRRPDGKIDWASTEDRAREMSNAEIHYALLDIQKTLAAADRLDRELGGDRGGYYRDEASVYHREIARRLEAR